MSQDNQGSYMELLDEMDVSKGRLNVCVECIRGTLEEGLLSMPVCEICQKVDSILLWV